MTLKRWLSKNGINSLIFLAGAVVFVFGFTEWGIAHAKNLLDYSPVAFYAILVPFTLTFTAWIILQMKKRVK